jgi:phosphoglycolate phosphatase-like HAD superfamily hydrolase
MSRHAPTLVLFDIDGTLILSGRAGVRALNRALAQMYGRADVLDGIPVAGRTDRAIVTDALVDVGVEPTPAAIDAVRHAYLATLPEELARPVRDPSGVLGGVPALLDELDRRADLRVGLLTGNFEQGAEMKLKHFQLWHRFGFGAFGDDHLDRRDLVPVAIARAIGAPPFRDACRVVVIGDTQLDIDCARAHGACAIAVATGGSSRAQLEAAGADVVVDSLAELDAILPWLRGSNMG